MTVRKNNVILVSSCLLGLDSRYDGISKRNDEVLDFINAGDLTVIPVCPEQLAGLPTPRPATQFSSGDGTDVLSGNGTLTNNRNETMNDAFVRGARQTLEIAGLNNCRIALMKERSPSCGVHEIYRNNTKTAGQGVTTALLNEAGVAVFSENELDELQRTIQDKEG